MASTIKSRAGSAKGGVTFKSPNSYNRETGSTVNSSASRGGSASGETITPTTACIAVTPDIADGLRLTRLDRSAYFDSPDDSAIVEVSEYLNAVIHDLRATIGEESEVAAIMRSKLEMDLWRDFAGNNARRVGDQIGRQCGIVVRTKVRTISTADKKRFYRMSATKKRRG